MPRDDQYRQKARLNEELAAKLDSTTAVAETWAVVIAFYSALHYVQAYFEKIGAGSDCHNHESREEEIARDPKLKYILSQYKYLFKMSHVARYKCVHLATEFPDPYKKATGLLNSIKTHIEKSIAA